MNAKLLSEYSSKNSFSLHKRYKIPSIPGDLYDLYDEIEQDIQLLGVTAIEDELQNNVEDTINKFLSI